MFLPFAAMMLAQATLVSEPGDYRALGASPLWQATIRDDFISFLTPAREMLVVETPSRQETEPGFAYSADALSISVEHAVCRDALTGRTFADRVTVRIGETRYEGCGGASRSAARPVSYGAAGSEPFWGLEIADGRLTFDNNGEVVIVRAPRPLVTGDGGMRRYRAPGISVLLKREDCEMEDERIYADTVTVTVSGRTFEGCGGRVLPPATLTNTDWSIVAIDGAAVSGDNYAIQFGEGRITGQAGCNRLSGAYTQRGDRLTAGPIMATRMACPGPRMTHERGVMNVLRGPVRIAFPAGDVLVLTGSGGTIRLRRN
jgi:heat shock protein HslJ/uncharacterized membrane protein